MTSGNCEAQNLVVDAWASFGEISLPPTTRILATDLDPDERAVFVDAFMTYSRESIPFDALISAHFILHFLTPEAFLYFLPRLIELCVAVGEEARDLETAIEVWFSTVELGTPDGDARKVSLDSLLNASQSHIVKRFIAYWRELWGGTQLKIWLD